MSQATYSGKARVLDRSGMMLDIGKAVLTEADPGPGWNGVIKVYKGSCLEAKSLTALVELQDGSRALAQVGPKVQSLPEDLIDVKVVGIDPTPF